MFKAILYMLLGAAGLIVVSNYILVGNPYYRPQLKYKLKERPFKKEPHYEATIRLFDRDNSFFCSGFVVDASYAITAAHCLLNDRGDLNANQILIKNSGDAVLTTAKAGGANPRLDYGIIVGDFSDFKSFPINASISFFNPAKGADELFGNSASGQYKVCGFPLGQRDLYCSEFVPIQPLYFQVLGVAQVFPGQSGGPVIDVNSGEVVGVATAMVMGNALITPVIGIFGDFELE